MKKYIFMAAVASLAIVSCNKDEVKEVNAGREIDFRTAVTRGAETTIQNLDEIYVTAYTESETNYFTDVLFAENAGYFTSAVKYYWPTDGSNINFMAYAPSASKLGVGDGSATELTINKTEQTLVAYSPAADVTAQEDVLVAKAVGSKADAIFASYGATHFAVVASAIDYAFSHDVEWVDVHTLAQYRSPIDNNTTNNIVLKDNIFDRIAVENSSSGMHGFV